MSLLISAEELRVLQETVRDQYRLMRWRQFVPVLTGIPTWAQDYRIVTVSGQAPAPKLASDPAARPGPNQLPMPSLSRRDTVNTFYRFALKYFYSDAEQERATRLGLNLGTERANANSQSFEEFLERVAFNGDASGEGAGLFGDIGVSNIATGSADVFGNTATLRTELPKAAGSGNQGWFDLSSGQATATATEMALDLVHICDTVRLATKDRNEATDIVMADALWTIAARTVSGVDSTRTALDIFRSMRPNVVVRPWYKLDGAGASGRHRIMAIAATDPDSPRMVLPQEMRQHAPYTANDELGFFVVQDIVVGGLLVKKPQLVAYLDPVNQA